MTTSTDLEQETQDGENLMTTYIDSKQETSNGSQNAQKKDPSTATPKAYNINEDYPRWISNEQLSEEEISELVELQNGSPWLSLEEACELANLQDQFPWLADTEVSEDPSVGLQPLWANLSEIDTRLAEMDEEETHLFAELMAGMDISANQLP